MRETAARYRRFGEIEARGSSPRYERLAEAVAGNDDLLDWLERLPPAKRQPNLLFASVRFLGGPTASASEFLDFVRTNRGPVEATMLERSTQTNEVARCGAFLPVLASLDADLALIEVGTSAGLCLCPDRYAYAYDGERIGDASLTIEVDAGGTVATPDRLPTVAWRAGLDLNPLDVSDPDHLAWLRACVWPEHDRRRERLDQAAAIVAEDPPRIVRGDLRTAAFDLIDEAPSGAIKVVFHSAVIAYLDEEDRRRFATDMRATVAARDDVLWLSNEAPSVIPELPDPGLAAAGPIGPARFLLGRDGGELIAHTDPHGGWIRATGDARYSR